MNTQEVIEKYFRDEKILRFHSSDKLAVVEGESYLRYNKNAGINLWVGGNSGEVCIIVTTDGEDLEKLIKAIIYG